MKLDGMIVSFKDRVKMITDCNGRNTVLNEYVGYTRIKFEHHLVEFINRRAGGGEFFRRNANGGEKAI